jgi:hypothetical protein
MRVKNQISLGLSKSEHNQISTVRGSRVATGLRRQAGSQTACTHSDKIIELVFLHVTSVLGW